MASLSCFSMSSSRRFMAAKASSSCKWKNPRKSWEAVKTVFRGPSLTSFNSRMIVECILIILASCSIAFRSSWLTAPVHHFHPFSSILCPEMWGPAGYPERWVGESSKSSKSSRGWWLSRLTRLRTGTAKFTKSTDAAGSSKEVGRWRALLCCDCQRIHKNRIYRKYNLI